LISHIHIKFTKYLEDQEFFFHKSSPLYGFHCKRVLCTTAGLVFSAKVESTWLIIIQAYLSAIMMGTSNKETNLIQLHIYTYVTMKSAFLSIFLILTQTFISGHLTLQLTFK